MKLNLEKALLLANIGDREIALRNCRRGRYDLTYRIFQDGMTDGDRGSGQDIALASPIATGPFPLHYHSNFATGRFRNTTGTPVSEALTQDCRTEF